MTKKRLKKGKNTRAKKVSDLERLASKLLEIRVVTTKTIANLVEIVERGPKSASADLQRMDQMLIALEQSTDKPAPKPDKRTNRG